MRHQPRQKAVLLSATHSPARPRVLHCLWGQYHARALPLTRAKKEVSSSSGKSTVSSSRKLAGVKLRLCALLRVLSFTERPCSQRKWHRVAASNLNPTHMQGHPSQRTGSPSAELIHASVWSTADLLRCDTFLVRLTGVSPLLNPQCPSLMWVRLATFSSTTYCTMPLTKLQ